MMLLFYFSFILFLHLTYTDVVECIFSGRERRLFLYERNVKCNDNFLDLLRFSTCSILKNRGRVLLETKEKDKVLNVSIDDFKPFSDIYKISNAFAKKISEYEKKKKKQASMITQGNRKSKQYNKFQKYSFSETFMNTMNSSISMQVPLNDKLDRPTLYSEKYDDYTFYATSQQIIDDITVDAKEISKNSIEFIGIKYEESKREMFTHNRFIMITNKGKKKYKISLMVKKPNYFQIVTPEKESKSTNPVLLEETVGIQTNKGDDYAYYYSMDHEKLYDGNGAETYVPPLSKHKENFDKDDNSTISLKKEKKKNVLRKILNFLNIRKRDELDESSVDKLLVPDEENIMNTHKKEGHNAFRDSEVKDEKGDIAVKNEVNDMNKNSSFPILSIDKLLDQYLMNTTVSEIKVQELIISFKEEFELTSEKLNDIITTTQQTVEKKLEASFLSVNTIKVEITYPINFVCFFIPSVFNSHNMNLLKDVLEIIHSNFQEYMEDWSFSHIYNVNENISDINTNEKKEAEQAKKEKRKKKKYIKKKKKLYDMNYSFLSKVFSDTKLIPLYDEKYMLSKRIEQKLLEALPKELAHYSIWHLTQTRVPNAWLLGGYGNEHIKVCIVDSGIDVNHADLAGNIHLVPYNKLYKMTPEAYDSMVKSPHDLTGHGTHVAGIVGGIINGIGVVGVAPKVKLVPLRFVTSKNLGGSYQAVKAINICIINKCPVINASWGSHNPDHTLQRTLNRLLGTLGGRGTVFITAAGNEQVDIDTLPLYPSSFRMPNSLSVASISKNLEISSFSNYGKNTVHIYAPGHYIYSTVPHNSYKNSTGTSMAVPHVSGISALIYSICHDQGYIPNATDVLDTIIRTSIKIKFNEKKTIHESIANAEGAVLTTILGGLWIQIDCKFSQFTLKPGKKKHVPIFFSAYKSGIYDAYLVVGVLPLDGEDGYGEIVIPIRLFTNSKSPIFKESPTVGKAQSVDDDEEVNDSVLEYICDNALFNLEESQYKIILIIIGCILIGFFFLILLIYLIKSVFSKEQGNETFIEKMKTKSKHLSSHFFKFTKSRNNDDVKEKLLEEGTEKEPRTEVNENVDNTNTKKKMDSSDLVVLESISDELTYEPNEKQIETSKSKTEK